MTERQRTVLIGKDEALIAVHVADAFADAGWTVIGPCGKLDKAERLLAQRTPDAALWDMSLTGGSSVELAMRLVADKVHVVFLNGNRASLVCSKPAQVDVILSVSQPIAALAVDPSTEAAAGVSRHRRGRPT